LRRRGDDIDTDSLSKVVYEEPIGTKMNDRDLLAIALHLQLNISETVRDRDLVPKDHQ